MIDSCSDCKTICCKHGPGPWKKLPPKEYLSNYGIADSYNTQCEKLVNGGCSIWDKPEFPVECRAHICHVRKFSKKELKQIRTVAEIACFHCDRDWTYLTPIKGSDKYLQKCDCCGNTEVIEIDE